ncbi:MULTISPECIES: CD3337/EF1877 family mobilome membrane protein [Paenibacillus]|uniref:CD3337/EF1877 family mobilome membrane protein n=1 Tax=Paenibacillus TaxID=44249 RepID=UPI0004666F8A|nr:MULTISPECIES: hypothetical protein [Paenibacillus]KGP78099.1 hypothetical protein P364_0130040 [Paenibacillus sp. MAEPY2]KGP89379.1 hypothetical protein P363_0101610 [Paenibacillus sp. MAEPY1]
MMIQRIKNQLNQPNQGRRWMTLCLVVFMLLGSILTSHVAYADSLDEMIPKDDTANTNYNKYGVSHYSFQTVAKDRHFWQVGDKAQDGIVRAFDHGLSMLFLANVQIARFFNFIAREAFTFSLMDQLIDAVADIIKSVTGINGGSINKGSFWDSLGGMLATITGCYVAILMVRGRFLDGYSQAFTFVMALVISLAFFANAGPFLKFANSLVGDIGNTIYISLAKTTGLKTDSKEGVTVISEQVWQELVIRPYTMLQFDDSQIAEKDPQVLDKVLTTDSFSDEREDALKEAATKYPKVEQERSASQMIIVLVNLAFSLFILGFFCFWAIATIFMRFKTLIHSSFMSITLLGALFPGREAGFSVIRSQFIKLIGLLMMTTMTMIFFNFSLVFGHLVYEAVAVKGGRGWFTGMIFEAIAVFLVFKYRDEITSVFSKATGVIPAMPKPKSTIVDSVQRNITRSLYNGATNKVSGLFNRREHEGVPRSFNPSSITKADNNLNDATSASMMLRYQREKQASEEIATEYGEPAQYTPFVQKVNDNLRNGTTSPFRGMDKEWKEEKGRLKDIKDDGGNVKQAILTQGVHEGMNDQEVAATIYGNENAIRQASTFMVQRPKRAVDQMERAKTLNRNRKLQTAVDDFTMIQLFDRYKVDYKQAVDTANMTDQPVQHTDFVKEMDSRFKASGLKTNQMINDTMLVRSGRISIASKFEGMDEFKKYKMQLLKANEAFSKINAPKDGIVAPGPQVRTAAPVNTKAVLSKMPPMPDSRIASQTQTLDQKAAVLLNVKPTMDTKMSPKSVNFNNKALKAQMDDSKQKLKTVMNADDLRLEINTETNQQVAIKMKEKISTEVSSGLQDELKHLKTMQRSRQVATVSNAAESLSKKVQNKARTARKQTISQQNNSGSTS